MPALRRAARHPPPRALRGGLHARPRRARRGVRLRTGRHRRRRRQGHPARSRSPRQAHRSRHRARRLFTGRAAWEAWWDAYESRMTAQGVPKSGWARQAEGCALRRGRRPSRRARPVPRHPTHHRRTGSPRGPVRQGVDEATCAGTRQPCPHAADARPVRPARQRLIRRHPARRRRTPRRRHLGPDRTRLRPTRTRPVRCRRVPLTTGPGQHRPPSRRQGAATGRLIGLTAKEQLLDARAATWAGLRVVVADVETIGLDVASSRVVSLALAEIQAGRVLAGYATLIHPGLDRIGAACSTRRSLPPAQVCPRAAAPSSPERSA